MITNRAIARLLHRLRYVASTYATGSGTEEGLRIAIKEIEAEFPKATRLSELQ